MNGSGRFDIRLRVKIVLFGLERIYTFCYVISEKDNDISGKDNDI